MSARFEAIKKGRAERLTNSVGLFSERFQMLESNYFPLLEQVEAQQEIILGVKDVDILVSI